MTSKSMLEANVRVVHARFDDVVSPCRGICRLRGDICRGCHRHIEEIKAWARLCREEKLEILRRLSYKG